MIVFEKVRYKNFLATGSQFTEIQLNRSKSTLIVGKNGNGKSTMIEAIVFVLYGSAFRDINKPQLVNSVNKKDCIVEIEFAIGTNKYVVRRGIKPNIFEIYLNDELINQDSASRDYQKHLEENILKMNKKSFTQIVILGSASFLPFMQLPAAHRREIVENLLDINIFTLMNQQLKERMSSVKDLIKNIETDITIQKSKIDMQKKYIETLESDSNKKRDETNANIKKTNDSIEKFDEQLNELIKKKTDLSDKVSGKRSAETVRDDITTKSRELTSKAKQIEKEIEFYKDHDICPTCSQGIDVAHCDKTVATLNDELGKIKVEAKKLSEDMTTYDGIIKQFVELDRELQVVVSEITTINARKEAALSLLQTYEKELNRTSVVDITEEKNKLKEIAREALQLTEQKAEATEQKHYYDVCGVMLKDGGIKARVVKQYLPVMNKLINKYLSDFDFFVSFELDESFNETIKSRHRDDFSYSSFSEGEKFRINLSILFTWREIARLKNSASTNLLICDELLDGALDQNALDSLFNIFDKMENTNLFVISHHPDSYTEKFRSVIEFEKVGNYSVMKGK